MLHIVVATHGPETCPLAVDKVRDKNIGAASRMEEVVKDYGCTLEGAWTSRASHTLYILMDGPNAHAVEDVLAELRFPEWETATITPVFTMQEGVHTLQRM